MPYYALLVSILLWIHLLAATVWVGGMAVMHFVVRPAAQQVLEAPPQRLAFMTTVLRHFFAWVGVAIGLLLATGMALVALAGAHRPHWSVTTMTVLGVLMGGLYAFIRVVPYARLRDAVAQSQWPAGAAAMVTIRRLVALNLSLGVLVYAVALIGRVL